MTEEHFDVTIDVVFPADDETKDIIFLNMQDGAEAARHVFEGHGSCRHCGITEFSAWRVHGGRDKDLCLARTDLYRDWARLFHEKQWIDPTGRIIAYTPVAVAEPFLRTGGVPKRLAWLKVVLHPEKHIPCVLLLSGHPSSIRRQKRNPA